MWNPFARGVHWTLWEKAALDGTRELLNADAATWFQRQIEQVNKIQRLSNGREVNLYCMRNGAAWLDESLRFPNVKPEERLSRVTLRDVGTGSDLSCDLWLVNGHVFSLVFDRAPAKASSSEIRVVTAKLLLRSPGQSSPAGYGIPDRGMVAAWLRQISNHPLRRSYRRCTASPPQIRRFGTSFQQI